MKSSMAVWLVVPRPESAMASLPGWSRPAWMKSASVLIGEPGVTAMTAGTAWIWLIGWDARFQSDGAVPEITGVSTSELAGTRQVEACGAGRAPDSEAVL